MILKPTSLLLAMTALLAAPAFAQTVATVNGKPIPASRVEQEVKRAVAQGGATDSPQLREAIKKGLIGNEVMIQEAEKQNVGARADVKATIDNTRQSIIINAMLADYLKKNPIKDADVKAQYEKAKADSPDKQYHVRHILLATEDEAKAVITKLKGGSKFEELAKQSKNTQTGPQGDDLGWLDARKLPPEISKVVLALQKGGVTETPVKTDEGFHVIKLDETRPVTIPPFDQVKQQVAQQMQQRKLAEFQQSLMKKAKIQ